MSQLNTLYFNAQFVTGAHKLNQLPSDSLIEVAFAGRSNAGKSSALNSITRNKKLARISKTPGRTQQINLFSLRERQYLVDLPGYGYAKVSKSQQQHWHRTLGQYLETREQLRCLVLVMDIRHALTDADWKLIEYCGRSSDALPVSLHCVLTKADKLGRGAQSKILHQTADQLEKQGIEATLQLLSSLKKTGIEDAHEVLDMHFMTQEALNPPNDHLDHDDSTGFEQ